MKKTIYVDWSGHNMKLTWIPTKEMPDAQKVTSVHSYCFDRGKILLAHVEGRGFNIPGGHVEKGETPEEALHREVLEEGCVQGEIKYLGMLEVSNEENPNYDPNSKYPFIGYQLFYRMDITNCYPFSRNNETLSRIWVEPSEIPYVINDHELSLSILEEALKIEDNPQGNAFEMKIDNQISLSLFETRHAEELFQLIDKNRAHLKKWLEFPNDTKVVEDSKQFILKMQDRFANNKGFWMGIWYHGLLVGSVGFVTLDLINKKAEIGYWLDEDYEGQGIVTKTIRFLIKYAFQSLHLNKIEIGVAVNHTKSRAIPERLGFVQEGIIRDYEYRYDEFMDRVIYGMKAREFKF